jgi:hypothetical protein
MAAEPRRSARAASGTPAPGTRIVSQALNPPAGGKKTGRPRKPAVDVVIEEEEKDIPASPVKRGRKSKSPGKNLVDVGKDHKDQPLIDIAAEPRRSTRAVSGIPARRTRAVGEEPATATATAGKKVERPSKKVEDAVLEEEEEEYIPSSPVKRKSPRKKAK